MRFDPFEPLAAPERVRLGLVPATGVSGPSPHAGVFKRSPSPSPSSSCADNPYRRAAGVPSSTFHFENAEGAGGEGVERGTDDGAVVPDEVLDGTRRPGLLGVVDIPEFNEPNDRSGIVPVDVDASGRELSAADIHCVFGRCG